MERYCDVIPFPGIAIAAVCGFVAGYLTASVVNHAKGKPRMTTTKTDQASRWRQVYETFAPAAVVFCVACSMFASVGVFWQSRVNANQDARRLQDNTAFIRCFDRFATDLSGSLPPVRKATAARDQALSAALGVDGLAGGFQKLNRGTFTDADLRQLIRLFLAYGVADAALAKARAENPYPVAPSKLCDLPE